MYLILALFIFVVVVSFAWAGHRGAPWVPTWGSDVERFLKLARIKPGEKVYDLGCGDGRLVAAASKSRGEAVGFEISLLPYLIAKIRGVFLSGNDRSRYKIKYKDFWGVDLSGADVVYFFLMPKVYPKLKQKLEKELRPGARVIAYVWPINGWSAAQVSHKKGKPNIYLYQQ